MRKIILTRKFNPLGCIIPYVVYWNNYYIGNITCGKTKTFEISEEKGDLHFECHSFGSRTSNSIELEAGNETQSFRIKTTIMALILEKN